MNGHTAPRGANGTLNIDAGFWGMYRKHQVFGGPFDQYPGKPYFGVIVRAEKVPDNYDVHLPIRDFDVPHDEKYVILALKRTITAILDDEPVYIGCMGGWGRTGLFMALLCKVFGCTDPIEQVRETYHPHAVETKAQAKYVADFNVSELQLWLGLETFKRTWYGKFCWWL